MPQPAPPKVKWVGLLLLWGPPPPNPIPDHRKVLKASSSHWLWISGGSCPVSRVTDHWAVQLTLAHWWVPALVAVFSFVVVQLLSPSGTSLRSRMGFGGGGPQRMSKPTHVTFGEGHIPRKCLVYCPRWPPSQVTARKCKPARMQSLKMEGVRWFATPWTAAQPDFPDLHYLLEFGQTHVHCQWCHPTISSCHPLPLLPSILPSIGVFSNESVLHNRWPEHWSFSISISLSNEYSGLISFRIDWFDLLAIQGTLRMSYILDKSSFLLQ